MANRSINRRRFLQAAAGGAALLAWPRRAYPFAQSPLGISKFAITLPGLGIAGENELHNYIPVLQAKNVAGTDTYKIVAREFSQQIHPNLPPTTFWGFVDAVNPELKYLGGVIVATRGTPVQLVVINDLPLLHILPVDTTLVEPPESAEVGGRTDRIAVHLHGGFVFWDSDGGPFAWYSSANNGMPPVHGSSFINGDGPGAALYNYPNDQSARFIWYHDHAYGLTRTNLFAGLTSAYLITDDRETALTTTKPQVIPTPPLGGVAYPLGIPLIIQDKTFWDGDTTPGGGDADYAFVVPAAARGVIGKGSLWYPHVYEGGEDPNGLPDMGLPPTSTLKARWGQTVPPPNPLPTPSSVPEYFSDTILVNGAPYPKVPVNPARYRFRIMDASNARFYNLQLYVADTTPDGITLQSTGELDNNDNPILTPTNRPGPAFIQIGNECGFLPAPAVFSANGANINSNRIIGYKLTSALLTGHLRTDAGREVQIGHDQLRLSPVMDPTVGNVNRYNLLMAPAERLDVIIDFRGFAGESLILYNDAPAPFPGGDIRNDYYGDDDDLTMIGGAPPTKPGFGPDTRVLMRFDVANIADSIEMNFAETVAALQKELPTIFDGKSQPSTNITPDPDSTFSKSLLEDNEDPVTGHGRLRQLIGDPTGAPSTLLDTPREIATVGQVQRWMIFNLTADTHPMHFHLVNVAVRGRQPWNFDPLTGSPVTDAAGNLEVLPGSTMTPPDPNEMGWKETVRMNPGEVTIVDMMFDLPTATAKAPAPGPSPRLAALGFPNAAEYVWHCHILEHEEHDMMHAVVVKPQP